MITFLGYYTAIALIWALSEYLNSKIRSRLVFGASTDVDQIIVKAAVWPRTFCRKYL